MVELNGLTSTLSWHSADCNSHARLFNHNDVAMHSRKQYCEYCASNMVRSKRYPQRLLTGADDVEPESVEDSGGMEEALEEEEEERRKRR